ncbi:MAG: tRNA (N(6)-L-threonylcarbamoyladenosine(37)-C(2))-methylthiotransferase MtaB [bacterium]|nr:tRNA (N(6)-L-threonylcarbamoyladenosine(37)-C(2))-methylthiotransferase MtaB [bacterium]
MDGQDGPRRLVRVAFHTLGCRLNRYDTESMMAGLPDGEAGALACEIVDWDEPADVYVLNSCTVTARADQKARQTLREARRRNPAAKVVVTGCYAQAQPAALAALPGVDGVFGTGERDAIAQWLPRLLAADGPLLEVGRPEGAPPATGSRARPALASRTRAHVKIQDGCDLRCAYCLVWRARGPARSRAPEAVLQEIAGLWDRGAPEVVLTGVHVGSYGRDAAPRTSLADLVAAILRRCPGLKVRLSSLHPEDLGEDLLRLYATEADLQPYLHLSLQSGADAVLARMRRPYAAADVVAAVAGATAARPGIGIGADVIAGFPGETDADFQATLDLVASLPLAYLHVFPFSARPGTAAAAMTPVPPALVRERADRLGAAGSELQRRFEDGLLGVRQEAIVESPRRADGWLPATTGNFATVLVPDAWAPGDLVLARPDGRHDGLLRAAEVVRAVVGEGER